jgi:hypothetical protein
VFLPASLREFLDSNEGLSMDVLSVSVPPTRLGSVPLRADRRAVFRSTTRAADEVFTSALILFVRAERSWGAIRPVLLFVVFSPTSMIFIRDVRASARLGVGRVVLAVSRVDARP